MDILPVLSIGSLVVVCAPHAARDQISALTANLALRGSVTVLDFGNRFRPYDVASALRQYTHEVNRYASRIFIRRAFTCYQVSALLENTPALRQPYIILDLLMTFDDENVNLQNARQLLNNCLLQIERLRQQAPVVLTLNQPSRSPERACLFELVCKQADRIFQQEDVIDAVYQPQLFQP